MNPDDYVSYPLALALKKAGFDYPCYFYYTRKDAPDDHVWSTTSEEAPIDYNRSVYAGCSMPTLAQAQKWLRERAIEVDVNPMFSHGGRDGYDWDVYYDFTGYPVIRGVLPFAETYESALSAGIAAALELIEKK
ncbi:hypothetical protein [Muribaculum intestinale]|uniref:hypothetical protein n=1 Tax=Muribaculum intestinale TaxID=1796646 RepID=UPI0025B3EB4E|nr:hypothetical protein [Muribaculum intestinale]